MLPRIKIIELISLYMELFIETEMPASVPNLIELIYRN